MAGGGCAWSRRVAVRTRTLRGLVKDTQRALQDVSDILEYDPQINGTVHEIGSQSTRPAALVILGTSSSARARLLHCLLGRKLLPDTPPRGCRWIRVQYGSSTQVHLTLGNSEFELVEELECNKAPWDTIPVQDLIRQDQTDLATMLEVELNNVFLKDGLRIIIPPDIDKFESTDLKTLKEKHSELYTKRDIILRNFNPIYLYAIDRIGKNIFIDDNICGSRIATSRSEEEFWSTFNLYHMTRVQNSFDSGDGDGEIEETSDECINRVKDSVWEERKNEPAVFTAENCLDLHQIKQINPNCQLYFFLFADSIEPNNTLSLQRRPNIYVEATESTEDAVFNTEELPESDQELVHGGVLRHSEESPSRNKLQRDVRRLYEKQIAFMNEMLDHWEMISSPPPKHYVKSQWAIVDDAQMLRSIEQNSLASFLASAIENANDSFGKDAKSEGDSDRTVNNKMALLNKVLKFATDCMQSYLLEYCTRLSEVHIKLLQQFILASFDLARELQIVPKKIQYVARQEQQLYDTINEKFSEGDKKQELLQIMHDVLEEIRIEIVNMDWSVDDLPCHQDSRFIDNSVFYASSRTSPTEQFDRLTDRPTDLPTDLAADQTPSDGEEAVSYDSYDFDDYEIVQSNDNRLSIGYRRRNQPRSDDTASVSSVAGDIHVENESELSSLWAGLSARGARAGATSVASSATCTTTLNISIKQASLDVQQTVLSKLSRKISLKLVKFVDCLRDTYFGTLQRCLDSLESSCRQELCGRPASEAVRQLLSVARQVDLQPCASFSFLRTLVESLRRFFQKLRVGGGEAAGAGSCCVLSAGWRRRAALHTAHSLTAHRLARLISHQILERLSAAHERYQSALATLEAALASRLHHTGDVKLAIRKRYAPVFARLCLESTSMCDLLMHGTPELGREIGRGQYGVVYSVRGEWAGHAPVAVKSVLPADERHYHELAMEFFYTRSIPAHPRIVRLYGSIVQRHSGGPTVLLVSERKCRDLYTAVRAGLSFATRMRIACDIVEGIRYLHSLGLVHRDIKMKNVLLDAQERAALSDLGFCAAEALISGSVVGTPIHMAPELLAGEYDAAVDVYAFGILFWYVCAGNIKLPSAFEVFQNKEQLWSKVKRGLRPERLPHFTDECWEVMESCWASEPSQRALLGDIQPKLEKILENAVKESQKEARDDTNAVIEPQDNLSDDDSLYMTGIHRNEGIS